jgi:hypothetical protein
MARSKPARRRLAYAVTVALAVPSALACNALVGLDEYTKVVCTGGTCDGGVPDVLSYQDVVTEASKPDGRAPDAGGTKPVSWANFHMPNYDAGPLTDNRMSYTATDGGFVDDVNSLVWQEPIVETAAVTYSAAQQVCASLTGGGRWRLPTRIELVTLLDLNNGPPAIAREFASTQPAAYWTSSEVRPFGGINPRKHWTVVFAGGADVLGSAEEDTPDVPGGKAGVRCIRDL